MRQWEIGIQRVEYREHIFRVTANTQDEAVAKARDAADNYNFSNSPVQHADEHFSSIKEVKT